MVFSSLTFLLLFLPITLLLYFLRGSVRWRNGILLIVSLVFYAWSEPIWILALVASTLVNYGCALGIVRAPRMRRLWLFVGVGLSLALLFYFKYATFFWGPIAALLGLNAPSVVMPIGVSFYTFQVLTYTVDVYRGKAQAERNPLLVLLYVSCFPQLVAGPIVQYADIAAEMKRRHTSMNDFIEGMKRFAVGLGKKVLLANICGLALASTNLADGAAELCVAGAWYSALLYTLQIFFDFSAYSDMAIGLGRVFGFHYKENFNAPYLSTSVSDFWRRWHISLGSFFRDYVYIPLGGNRKGAARTVLNLLLVWSLTGLWHGASWNFIVWGAYYGVLIVLERFVFQRLRAPKALSWLLTMLLVMIGWVLFYYVDLRQGATHLLAMFGMKSTAAGLVGIPLLDATTLAVMKQYTAFPLIACLCALPLARWLRARMPDERSQAAWNVVATVALTAVLIASVACLVGQSYNPFIYFRF